MIGILMCIILVISTPVTAEEITDVTDVNEINKIVKKVNETIESFDMRKKGKELCAHTTMLKELKKKIDEQQLKRMVHDANAEIDIIIKNHEIHKTKALKAKEKNYN